MSVSAIDWKAVFSQPPAIFGSKKMAAEKVAAIQAKALPFLVGLMSDRTPTYDECEKICASIAAIDVDYLILPDVAIHLAARNANFANAIVRYLKEHEVYLQTYHMAMIIHSTDFATRKDAVIGKYGLPGRRVAFVGIHRMTDADRKSLIDFTENFIRAFFSQNDQAEQADQASQPKLASPNSSRRQARVPEPEPAPPVQNAQSPFVALVKSTDTTVRDIDALITAIEHHAVMPASLPEMRRLLLTLEGVSYDYERKVLERLKTEGSQTLLKYPTILSYLPKAEALDEADLRRDYLVFTETVRANRGEITVDEHSHPKGPENSSALDRSP